MAVRAPSEITTKVRSHAIVVASQQIVEQLRDVGMNVALRVVELGSRIIAWVE